MQFTLAQAFNATAEIAAVTPRYSSIRVFTVGQGTTSNVSLSQLGSIVQTWANATPATIGLGKWNSFSATCWFFVRDVFDALGGTVPIGAGTVYVCVVYVNAMHNTSLGLRNFRTPLNCIRVHMYVRRPVHIN